MAISNGIEYFPMNVDFFEDDKIALIESEFGIKGSSIAIRLLCKIYREGYFYQWGDDECLLFARKVGDGIVPNFVKEVVNGLVKRSFFDKRVFDRFKVLTSAGIQNRYFEASKRRQRVVVNKDFLLVDVSKFPNVYISDGNVYISQENAYISEQKKRKESKREESKVNDSISISSREREEQQKERIFRFPLFVKHIKNAAAERQRFMDVYVSTLPRLSTRELAAKLGFIHTPTANDSKNSSLPPSQMNRIGCLVKDVMTSGLRISQNSRLNPRYVAEMMGFPKDWTELPFRRGAEIQ